MRALAYLPAPFLIGTALVAATPADPDPLPSPGGGGSIGEVVARFDARRALEHARRLTACGPRPPASPCHAAARAYALAELARVLPDAAVDRAGNVVAGAASGVIIGAHYDTRPGTPGAADNAAGVGIVLEAARALGPRSDLGVVLWDREEEGMVGSAAHARSLPSPPRAVVAVDLIGWDGGAPVAHTLRHGGGIAPGGIVATALAAGADLGDPVLSLPYQAVARAVRVPFGSDDAPYRRAGAPALFLSDSSLSRFYPHYHAPADTHDRLGERAVAAAGRALVRTAELLLHPATDPAAHGARYLAAGRRVVGGGWLSALAAALALPALVSFRVLPFTAAAAFAAACVADLPLAVLLCAPAVLLCPLGRAGAIAGLLPPAATAAVWLAARLRFGAGFAPDLDPARAAFLLLALVPPLAIAVLGLRR